MTSLTDATGALAEQYTYDVYGAPTIKDGSGHVKAAALTPFLFTGREYDQETGLYHYRTRAYSPAIGRFLQTDSISFNGGDVNLYRYVGNDVVNKNDPQGSAPPAPVVNPGTLAIDDDGSEIDTTIHTIVLVRLLQIATDITDLEVRMIPH